MEVTIKEQKSKGFALAKEQNYKAGTMTYSKASSTLIIIDHTEVEEAYKGKGVGKKMLYKIVEMAREKQLKILPLCPFASAMFKREDIIKDVL